MRMTNCKQALVIKRNVFLIRKFSLKVLPTRENLLLHAENVNETTAVGLFG